MISEKEKRFIRIAERRTNNILYMIRVLGNLSNKNVYEYNEAQVEKIFTEIQKQLDDTKKKFDPEFKPEEHDRFTL